jgi:hypothetical protein
MNFENGQLPHKLTLRKGHVSSAKEPIRNGVTSSDRKASYRQRISVVFALSESPTTTNSDYSAIAVNISKTEVKALITARDRVKASLTRLETFVQQHDETQDILNVKLCLPRLKETWEKFENIQDGLESLEDDPYKHDEYRSEFENLFYEVNVAMTHLIEENDAWVLQGQERRSLEGSVHSNNSRNHHSHIKLPTFNGRYKHWISFSDMFKAMVHDNVTQTSRNFTI